MRSTLYKSLGLDSVGRYFYSDKKNGSEKNLSSADTGRGGSEEMQETNKDGSIKKIKSEKSIADSEDFEGPDTSSLTAFLLSLLSYPSLETSADDDSSSSDDSSDEDEGPASRNQAGGGGRDTTETRSRMGFSFFSRGQWDRVRSSQKATTSEGLLDEQQGTGIKPLKPSLDDDGKIVTKELVRGIDELSEAEWQIVSDSDARIVKKYFSVKNNESGEVETPKTPKTPKSPFRLPEMSEESFILTESMRTVIYNSLPALAKGREWVLLYSTVKHGISLLTLYRRSGFVQGPCLLVVSDKEGNVFGGLSTGPLQPSTKKKYQGTSDSFVFTDVSGSTQLFRSSGINRYFVLCMNDALAFGGGGHFALRLDGELLHGSSGSCETFGSPCLTKNEEFSIKKVELWGFAHTSKYAPKGSTWHEPEASPGIHTW